MKTPSMTIRNSARVALAVHSNNRTPEFGSRPNEQDIIAWAEGRISGVAGERIKHWVANDENCFTLLRDHLEFADLALAAEPAINHQLAPAERSGSTEIPAVLSLTTRLQSLVRCFVSSPVALGACATLATVSVLLITLLTDDVPLGLSDYQRMASSPAENWRQLALLDASTRALQPSENNIGKTAFLFGVRSSLEDLGIQKDGRIEKYFNSLPTGYPICSRADELCEQNSHWHFRLGQWVVLTERSCNTTLGVTDREALLTSQNHVLSLLVSSATENNLPVQGTVQTLLTNVNKEALCRVSTDLHNWGDS